MPHQLALRCCTGVPSQISHQHTVEGGTSSLPVGTRTVSTCMLIIKTE
jgi:hypothetical protein